jgi:hypothetical protein
VRDAMRRKKLYPQTRVGYKNTKTTFRNNKINLRTTNQKTLPNSVPKLSKYLAVKYLQTWINRTLCSCNLSTRTLLYRLSRISLTSQLR